MTSGTTVYWGPVAEADVVCAALRAAGVPAELVYQSTGIGALTSFGPTDSRVVVPDDFARPAAELIARAEQKRKQDEGATRPARTKVKVVVARVFAVVFLAYILWVVARMTFPGLRLWSALPF